MLTNVKPHAKILYISNLEHHIHEKTLNLKSITLLDQFSHFETDEIDRISLRDVKFQKTSKNHFLTILNFKFTNFHNSQLLSQNSKLISKFIPK